MLGGKCTFIYQGVTEDWITMMLALYAVLGATLLFLFFGLASGFAPKLFMGWN